MLVQIQLERNSKMKTLLPSNIFSGSSDKLNGKEQGCIKAGPMTKALTLQFMNGFGAHPHFGGKAHISPCRKRPYCKRFGNGSNPLVGAEDANFRKVAGSYISACLCNIYKRNQDATKCD